MPLVTRDSVFTSYRFRGSPGAATIGNCDPSLFSHSGPYIGHGGDYTFGLDSRSAYRNAPCNDHNHCQRAGFHSPVRNLQSSYQLHHHSDAPLPCSLLYIAQSLLSLEVYHNYPRRYRRQRIEIFLAGWILLNEENFLLEVAPENLNIPEG